MAILYTRMKISKPLARAGITLFKNCVNIQVRRTNKMLKLGKLLPASNLPNRCDTRGLCRRFYLCEISR